MTAAVAAGEFQNLEQAARTMVHVGKTYKPNLDYVTVYDRKFAKYMRMEREVCRMFAEEAVQ